MKYTKQQRNEISHIDFLFKEEQITEKQYITKLKEIIGNENVVEYQELTGKYPGHTTNVIKIKEDYEFDDHWEEGYRFYNEKHNFGVIVSDEIVNTIDKARAYIIEHLEVLIPKLKEGINEKDLLYIKEKGMIIYQHKE